MPPRRRPYQAKRPIESYDHRDKERLNNPPVGLVTPETDRDAGRKTYAYDPHLDPQLQWAGQGRAYLLRGAHGLSPRPRAHRPSHHHRGYAAGATAMALPCRAVLFELPEENPPVRNAIEFYRHRHNWTNRLVAGDSLLVMNSLLEKEGMAGKVQMVYIDPRLTAYDTAPTSSPSWTVGMCEMAVMRI